jgi:pyruvate ferredoxin oxidoreductase alpha subunit
MSALRPPVVIEKPKVKVWTGARAIAEAVRVADVDVIAAYPIRPYTGIMNALAKMIADGEFVADIIPADSEHSQFEIVKHASAVGARTFAGSSGVGLIYATEAIIVTALGQLPVVAAVGTRALDDPGNFGMEWSDALMFRDFGWLISWPKTVQEATDMTVVAYRVSEDRRVLLPQFIALDGAAITHVAAPVTPPTEEEVAKFLPPYRPPYPIDPAYGPVTKGQHIAPSLIGPEQRKVIDVSMKRAKEVIVEAWKDFERYTGRHYPPFIEAKGIEDADIAVVSMGVYMKDIEYVAEKMRNKGVKVGTVRLRYIRPFPAEELVKLLDGKKAVGVIEFGYSFGSPFRTGSLYHEVATTLYEADSRPVLTDYLFLGGREPKIEHFATVIEKVEKTSKQKPEKKVFWVTLRGEDI